MFFLSSTVVVAFFAKIIFFEKFFHEYNQSAISLDQARHFTRPDLDSNCLRML